MRVRATIVALVLTGLSTPAAGAAAAHPVPPAAPSPTSSASSPEAPDPHPPLGGLGPDGRPVGGARLLLRGLVLPLGAPALPKDITARAWVVVDLDTGAVLGARDPHGRYQPASIQKLLTTVTLLPRLPGTMRVRVSRAAAETEGSRAGLIPNHPYTVDQLFEGLLLVSGNDCAEALAAAAGGRARTVVAMNREALRLGAYDTYVQTPSGLDGWQQLTSAYDMALVLRAALADPRFERYDRVEHTVFPGGVGVWNQNTDFLTTVKGALVAKTGYTDAAQHTFVGAIRRGGHRYGVVLMRAQRWPVDQWVQATRLIAWARSLPAGTAPVGELATPAVPAPAHASTSAPRRSSSPVTAVHGQRPSDTLPLAVQVVLGLVVVAAAGLLSRRHHLRRVRAR